MREVRAVCERLPKDLDAVILGCTHYPFLLPHFEAVLGKTTIVDPGKELVTDFEEWLNFDCLDSKDSQDSRDDTNSENSSDDTNLRARIKNSLVE